MKAIIIIITLCSSVSLFAQAPSEFGYADKSIPELSQFEYFRGVWSTTMEMKQEDGTFKKLNVVATVKEWFLDDHKTFQSQFTTPDGFFSTDLRTWNTTTKEWKALFLNANAQRWHEFTCKMENGKMTTIVLGGYSGKEEFDIKGVDTVISDNAYHRDIYYSYDHMKTWTLVYKMDAKKVE